MKASHSTLLAFGLMAVAQPLATAQAPAPGDAILSVSSGLPQPAGRATPVALLLLRESFAEVLKKSGTTLAAWSNACRSGQAAVCEQGLNGMKPVAVSAAALFAPAVSTTFSGVAPGSYYLFAQTLRDNQHLLWDMRVDLRSGANTVTIDLRNTTSLAGPQPQVAAVGPAAQPAQATDPSIAKARAAKVDTRVFGIPLGEALRLPECDPLASGNVLSLADGRYTPSATCVSELENLASSFVQAFSPFKVEGAPENVKTILLAKDSCPAWMTKCEAFGVLHEGLLVAMVIGTRGRR